MDRILRELFGGDEPQPAAGTRTETTSGPADSEREARREARQRRKADAEARRSRREFVERYTTGDPSEGFTTEEAIAHLREMRDEMTPEEFRRAMQRTLEHLPPSQRDDFIKIMREYQAGSAAPGASTPASTAAPGSGAASADPFAGLLTGLMGSSAAGAGGIDIGDVWEDLTKGGLRAPSATPGEKPTAADFQALLNSPLARAVLGGVAAFGIQEMEKEDETSGRPSGTGSRG